MPKRKKLSQKEVKARVEAVPYWYHKIELPGVTTPGWAPLVAGQHGLPADLTGKRVLDVGGWDGYWTFEALKRGAKEVVCIDDFSDRLGSLTEDQRPAWETFDLCREALGYSEKVCKRIELSVYEVDEDSLGRFDVVLLFGTLYHLKYPQFALDKLGMLCDGRIYVESAVCDYYSVYRGGFGKGYSDSVVAEFYPGDQYGGNASNWWVPSMKCLGAMLSAAGFHNVETWPLTEQPAGLPECRGFACGTKDPDDISTRGETVGQVVVTTERRPKLKIGAAMSVPRLGFTDSSTCIFEALTPLKMPIYKEQGVFWEQCLERALEHYVDAGMDAVLTIDYDTIFTADDVLTLIRLMEENPDVDALVPVQQGRGMDTPLLSIKQPSGRRLEKCPPEMFASDLTKITTGHFGLTLIRTSALLDMPHPWFHGQPDAEGRWGPTKTDADITFWRKMAKHSKRACLANRVTIGHGAGDVIIRPSERFQPLYQTAIDYRKVGKPEGVWK